MNVKKEILKKIKQYDKIIITTHVRADGDCVGSGIALREIIRESFPNKEVYCSHEYVDYLKYLGKPDILTDQDFQNSLIISVDNASLKRANDPRITNGLDLIKIDHHPNREPFGSINWVEDEKCACAEMILDFFLENKGLKMNKLAIEALFTGIMTDSGFLKYSGVNGDTLIKVGYLYNAGLNAQKIINTLNERSLEEAKFQGYVLNNMSITENGVIYIKITPAIREEYKVTYDDASNMVNKMSDIVGSPIWVLFNEYKEDEIRCRVRSLGVKINDIAENFGGGGHENASGIVVKDYATVDQILAALDERLKEYKNN